MSNMFCNILIKIKDLKSLCRHLSPEEQRDVCDILHMVVCDLHALHCQGHSIRNPKDCKKHFQHMISNNMISKNFEDMFETAPNEGNIINVDLEKGNKDEDNGDIEISNEKESRVKNQVEEEGEAKQRSSFELKRKGKNHPFKRKTKSSKTKLANIELGNCIMTHFQLERKSPAKTEKSQNVRRIVPGRIPKIEKSCKQILPKDHTTKGIENQKISNMQTEGGSAPENTENSAKQKVWKFTNYDGPIATTEGNTPNSNTVSNIQTADQIHVPMQTAPAKKWTWIDCHPQNYRNVSFSQVCMSVPVGNQEMDARETLQPAKKLLMDKLKVKLSNSDTVIESFSSVPSPCQAKETGAVVQPLNVLVDKISEKSKHCDKKIPYKEDAKEEHVSFVDGHSVKNVINETGFNNDNTDGDLRVVAWTEPAKESCSNGVIGNEQNIEISRNPLVGSKRGENNQRHFERGEPLSMDTQEEYCLELPKSESSTCKSHEVLSTCPLCDVGFDSQADCKEHLEKSHKTYTCPQCGLKNFTIRRLKAHHSACHNSKLPNQHTCELCSKSFETLGKLCEHKRRHDGERPAFCEACKCTFISKSALHQHERTQAHRKTAGEKQLANTHACKECGKQFDRKYTLARHLIVHKNEEKKHSCSYCAFKCKQKRNLQRHIALHFEKDRNFICELCGSAFHQKKTLESHHLYKHSNVRKHSCEICGSTFKLLNNLVRHQAVHGEEKSYQCLICEAHFNRLCNLRRHMKKFHGTEEGLPKVNRVETVDSKIKSPTSKTDHVIDDDMNVRVFNT